MTLKTWMENGTFFAEVTRGWLTIRSSGPTKQSAIAEATNFLNAIQLPPVDAIAA